MRSPSGPTAFRGGRGRVAAGEGERRRARASPRRARAPRGRRPGVTRTEPGSTASRSAGAASGGIPQGLPRARHARRGDEAESDHEREPDREGEDRTARLEGSAQARERQCLDLACGLVLDRRRSARARCRRRAGFSKSSAFRSHERIIREALLDPLEEGIESGGGPEIAPHRPRQAEDRDRATSTSRTQAPGSPPDSERAERDRERDHERRSRLRRAGSTRARPARSEPTGAGARRSRRRLDVSLAMCSGWFPTGGVQWVRA